MKACPPKLKDLIKAVRQHKFERPLAVTLTMKFRANGQPNDRTRASINCHHFLNRVNARLFGSAAKRYGRKLDVFSVLEENAEGRLHFHMIVDCPADRHIADVSFAIREEWPRTDFGYRHIEIKSITDDGWLSYMLKRRQKGGNFLDSIDWANCTTILG